MEVIMWAENTSYARCNAIRDQTPLERAVMFSSWIVDPDPVISLDLAEILLQRFNGSAPKMFETAGEAISSGGPLPALAILRATEKDPAMPTLIARLTDAAIPLILLESALTTSCGPAVRSVALPFTSDDITAAINGLFCAPQKPTPRPGPR